MYGITRSSMGYRCCRFTTRDIQALAASPAPVCRLIPTIHARADGQGAKQNAGFTFNRLDGLRVLVEYAIGFLIAFVMAITGVGAGSITAPLLLLFLNVPVEIGVGTALAYSTIVKLIVVPIQIWRRQVNYRILTFMLIGGLPGVILGSVLFR